MGRSIFLILRKDFSSVVAACFILFVCVSQTSALVIPKNEIVANGILEEFSLHITENGTVFTERIKIDEEKGVEYFHVPAHNRVTEAADYLYDFKKHIAIRRVESKAACYLEPFPDDLPKPADLKKDLQTPSDAPPFEDKIIVQKYWIVTEQVDKGSLSEDVQQFCDQFPVYRLMEIDLNSVNTKEINGERTRFGRDLVPSDFLNQIGLCDYRQSAICPPEKYIFRVKIQEGAVFCTWWWLSCKLTKGGTILEPCDKWEHKFDSMVCYEVHCPTTTTAAPVTSTPRPELT